MAQTQTFGAGTGAYAGTFAGNRPIFQQLQKRLSEALTRRRVYHRTLAELRSLSRRELADIRIAPSQITRIAKETAYGQ